MNELVLHCGNVSKKIGNKVILENVSFDIYSGDIFGFIGPNGSGKTTMIKLILDLQKLDSGLVTINNYNIKKDFKNAIESVGAIVETPAFYEYMSGRDNLKLISNNNIDEVVKLVGLNSVIDKKVSKYSLGMKQRLGLARAIINNPKLLILDEPTNGLDIDGIKMLKDIIKTLSSNGTAILISSHILSELDNLCNKICIIKNGKIINSGDLYKLKHQYETSFIIEVSSTENINLLFKYELISNNKFKVYCNREFIPLIVESLSKSDIKIYSIKEEIISLEDIFYEEENID